MNAATAADRRTELTFVKTMQNNTFLSRLLYAGIIACTVTILGSLYFMYRPFTPGDILRAAGSTKIYVSEHASSFADACSDRLDAFHSARVAENRQTADAVLPDEPVPLAASVSDTGEEIPYIEESTRLGDVSELDYDEAPTLDSAYIVMLDTGCGPMLYYNQGDSRWRGFLYGGNDRMSKYGCGPAAVAMLVNSFTETSVTPVEMAQWSADNGYYALHGGSYHALIPEALKAYGLNVTSVTDYSREHAEELLSSGHILVALMGRGSLTQGGHFVLFTRLLEDGNIRIADPANYENCMQEWDLDQLLSELKKSYDDGAPLWAVLP